MNAAANAPVIIAYDGSAEADLAATWAGRYAAATGAPLRAVVVVPPDDWSTGLSLGWGEEYPRRLVEDVTARLREVGIEDPVVETYHGPLLKTLIDLTENAALMVLGSLGHGRLAGAFLGSVSQAVTRRAVCPVVVVREPADPSATRIVVGIDGSEHSERALRFAVGVAEAFGAPVAVRYGWRLPNVRADLYGTEIDGLGARIDAEKAVPQEIVARVRADHPEVEIDADAVPVAPAALLADASETAALVVVGSRGRTALEGMLLGSVGQDVLHRAQCAVAVIP